MAPDDIYLRNPARDIEQYAVEIVTAWVGDRGQVQDTSAGPDPDFRIEYRDGRLALGEVGWHEDRIIREMWSNTFRHEQHQTVNLPQGYGSWGLGLSAGANVSRLYRDLPAFIGKLLELGISTLETYNRWPPGPLADRARSLGITYISHMEGSESPVAIFFMPHSGGVMPTDANGIVEWIDAVLTDSDYQDTTQKLLKHEADERHVFLMTGSAAPFGVQELLWRADIALPTRDPVVPGGITHVWATPQFGGTEVGAVLWSPHGWSSVGRPDTE